MGIKLSSPQVLEGEVVADSPENVDRIAAWVDQMKALLREKAPAAGLDELAIEKAGSTLRFSAKDSGLLATQPSTNAVNPALDSDFGAEVYSLLMAGLPGQPARVVAGEKLRAVKKGMTKDEVFRLAGAPLGVTAIQGLEEPRETWTYQIAFGKQVSFRLDAGVVTATPVP